jgi:sterol desaturase/sphingolipid hydroxylase (fatty acid hydroxylase superfamily)
VPHAAAVLSWFTAHAVLVLGVSATAAVVLEHGWARLRGRAAPAGTRTSIAAGLAYLGCKGIVSKGLMFGVALAVYDHRMFDLDATSPLVWLGVFVGRDLGSYLIHRAEHRVRLLWASHLVHHSLEQFTFTSAVRLPWMESLYKPFLVLWIPFLGFHPAALAAMGALVLLVGQLQHTELGRTRTWLDLVFVTPSAHRVHHGSNPEYLDRNFGSMLIVWDRLFGTYAPETVPVRYGLTGGLRVTTAGQALTGGYPKLVAAARDQVGTGARARYLVGAP